MLPSILMMIWVSESVKTGTLGAHWRCGEEQDVLIRRDGDNAEVARVHVEMAPRDAVVGGQGREERGDADRGVGAACCGRG
jgi:hypothetical protein